MIKVTGVNKSFGATPVLTDVSVDIASGSLTALLGPSGGGKSTLLRIIAGLETPDTGTVLINGTDATRLSPQRRNVGFVFQHYAAFKHLTVYRNIAFGLEVRKRPKAEIRKRVDELLELVHLEQMAGRYPNQLSGGQRQRMALARALAVEPEVLLLDEPFGALDAQVRKELRTWLRRLHDEVHVTTVFVTHDQEEAMDVSDEIVLLADGIVQQVGPPNSIYDNPANPFVMSFLGPVTQLDGQLVRPHDVDVSRSAGDGRTPATVTRVVSLGFEIRIEATSGDRSVWAQLTRAEAKALDVKAGDTVYLRPAGHARPLPV
jgi:sulfate transport system ATP-binding protein